MGKILFKNRLKNRIENHCLGKAGVVYLRWGKSYTTSSYWTPPGRERSKGRWS